MSSLFTEDLARQIKEVFADLTNPVEVLFFGQESDCTYCQETLQLLQQVASLSEKIEVCVYDLEANAEEAQKYKIVRAPGFVIVGRDGDQAVDYGIRYSGFPSGYEFTSLVNDLVMVSSRNSALADPTRAFLKGLDRPIQLQVFVTPTCPYCPRAVVLAHQLALESPMVEAEMIEFTEFFDLASSYGVTSVPHTVINRGAGNVIGAAPEETLIEEIKKALGE